MFASIIVVFIMFRQDLTITSVFQCHPICHAILSGDGFECPDASSYRFAEEKRQSSTMPPLHWRALNIAWMTMTRYFPSLSLTQARARCHCRHRRQRTRYPRCGRDSWRRILIRRNPVEPVSYSKTRGFATRLVRGT